ncbi:putative protein serine/threonine kinase [Tieghemostelium lacteum]|uniref:non-specific serine/threonine protein kinase n=1 Tax=Tieghemostelium lacteum TaxID=361077 RepID=A0A151ZK44_TIELA|nr:putative protein serine/threonine kinase [Tieghemostelium lacteum]|eukprot:KYQ94184.1 putative protein serine/threonine kinase [Tieghemostelium lacteum]
MDMDPMSHYNFIKDLRTGGEGKAILLEKNGTKYVCKQRIFNSLNEANVGLKEAYSLASIVNENIVKFEDIFLQSKDGIIYLCIIMEYCAHGDLLDFLIDLSDRAQLDTTSDLSSDTSSETSDVHSAVESLSSISNTSAHKSESDLSSAQQPPMLSKQTNSNKSFNSASNLVDKANTDKKPEKKEKISCKKKKKKCIIMLTKEFTRQVIQHMSGASKETVVEAQEETLKSDEIKKDANSQYLIEQSQLLDWMLQLCYGVQGLHKAHLIHRDLKSENIFITKANKLKIGDFGLAIKSSVPSIKGAVGTYIYSAPEVLEGKTYDKSADVFSLGCIFYELITLRLLLKHQNYIGEDLIHDRFDNMKFLSTFPTKYYKLGPLVLKMLDKNPTMRPSIEYIIDKLENLEPSTFSRNSSSSLRSDSGLSTPKGIRKQIDKKEIPEASKVMAAGFLHDPRYSTLFPPSEPNSQKHLEVLFKFMLKKMLRNGCNIWAYYDGNKMVSCSCFFNPDKKKEIKFSDFLVGGLTFLTKFGLKKTTLGTELFVFIDKILHESSQSPKHWFLSNIATDPSYQNQSIGSYLVEPVLSWSDHSEVGIKTMVFNKKNFPFFNRLGFEVVQEITKDLPKGITGCWIMYREPKPHVSVQKQSSTINLAASVNNSQIF